ASSACPFVCARAKLRSLPQGLPAAGLGTGGSADLMNFYATSYGVAHGQLRFRPHLGHHTGAGYASNNHSAVSCLLCPRSAAAGQCQDTTTSTTAEDFKPFWLPDGRSLLPRHVHQPGSGYLQESSLSCLRTGAVGPRQTRLLQGPPPTSRERGPKSRCADPAQPDVLRKTAVGTKEQSGFTKATPRSDGILPALPGQPVSPSPAGGHACPIRSISILRQGSEALPALPAGSKRGSGFSREAPGGRGAPVSR
ncbi:PPR32 phosphatase, partial [Scopus umbretta]|nr:PPR32 phosphatase [Scopus umbretta]